jgi:pyrroline-5-carboxylate reductase
MKIGFIGGGKMGEAILSDLIRIERAQPSDICMAEIDTARRDTLAARHGIRVTDRATDVMETSDVVFVAVKPQVFDDCLSGLSSSLRPRHLLISIAAGKTLAGMSRLLPGGRFVRVMPNLGAAVSESMNAFCVGDGVSLYERETVHSLLESFGKVVELPEEQFDAVTAISGSGPAFLAYFAQLMIEGGATLGVSREDAVQLVGQTMLGTAKVLLERGFDTEAFIAAVSSKGGTTEAGMGVLREAGIAEPIRATLAAAAKRSQELSAPQVSIE